MRRQALDCGGSDFDFIVDDDGLRIFHQADSGIRRIDIKRSLLLQLFEMLPLTELKQIEEDDELPF